MTMFTCVSLSEVPKKDGLGSWQILKQSRVHYHFLLLKQGLIWSTVKVKAFVFFHIFSIQSFCVMNRPVFIPQCYNHNNVSSIWKSQACFIMCLWTVFVRGIFGVNLLGCDCVAVVSCSGLMWVFVCFGQRVECHWERDGRWAAECRPSHGRVSSQRTQHRWRLHYEPFSCIFIGLVQDFIAAGFDCISPTWDYPVTLQELIEGSAVWYTPGLSCDSTCVCFCYWAVKHICQIDLNPLIFPFTTPPPP